MIVLAASALVDVVADRPARDAVLDYLDTRILAPSHQLAEVSSAIIRLLRAEELTPQQAEHALADAAALRQEVTVIDGDLVTRAWQLRDSIRILDGFYVALAERHRCPVVTTDGRLARAHTPCEVIYPGS